MGGTLTVDSGATIAPTGALSVDPANPSTPATIVNDGLIATSGTTVFVSLSDSGNLINDGTIVSTSGPIIVGDTLFNNGSASIAGGAIVVGGTIASGAISFDGAGSLTLRSPMAFADGSSIAGFGQGDRIVLSQLPGDSMALNGGTLDVLASGTLGEAIPISGSLGLGNFELNIFPAQGPFHDKCIFRPRR